MNAAAEALPMHLKDVSKFIQLINRSASLQKVPNHCNMHEKHARWLAEYVQTLLVLCCLQCFDDRRIPLFWFENFFFTWYVFLWNERICWNIVFMDARIVRFSFGNAASRSFKSAIFTSTFSGFPYFPWVVLTVLFRLTDALNGSATSFLSLLY